MEGFISPEGEVSVNTPYQKENIAYHIWEGAHAITELDWKLYMDFCDKYFK